MGLVPRDRGTAPLRGRGLARAPIAAAVTGRPVPARVVVLDHEGHVFSDRELAGTAFVFAGDRVLTNASEIVRLSDHARVGTLERAPRA